jgi:hypothetical protein
MVANLQVHYHCIDVQVMKRTVDSRAVLSILAIVCCFGISHSYNLVTQYS